MAMSRKSNDFAAGYVTSKNPLDNTPRNSLASPSRNLLYDRHGHVKSFNGYDTISGGGSTTFYLDNGWASLGSHETTDVGAGNVFEYYNKSLIFVGSGTVKAFFPSVNASVQTIGVASSIPQIAVLNGAGTGWEVPQQLGLAPQGISPSISAPSAIGAGFSGLVRGVRAMKIAAVRSSTGGLSNASPASNVLEFTNSSVLVEIPPARTDGSDIWRLYITPAGFGNIGFFLQIPVEITEDDVDGGTVNVVEGNVRIVSTANPREIELEFDDSELLDLQAPIDQFPASDASFVSAIGNVVLLIGTFKGVGLSASNPNQPEAYPPTLTSFITETVVGVSRPTSGFLYILCQNSVWIAMMSGAVMGGTPVIARSFINNTGVKNNKAAVTIGDALYIFSSGGKPVRISPSGEIDVKFGDRVIEEFSEWDPAKAVLSYDETANRVIYSHEREVMSYDIDNDRWNAPVRLDHVNGLNENVTAVSAFTKDGISNQVFWDSVEEEYIIGLFDQGTAGSAWIAREQWDSWGDYRKTKDMIYASLIVSSEDGATELDPTEITGRIYKDFQSPWHSSFSVNLTVDGMKVVPKISVRAYAARVFATELSGNGFGHTVIIYDTDADMSNIS